MAHYNGQHQPRLPQIDSTDRITGFRFATRANPDTNIPVKILAEIPA